MDRNHRLDAPDNEALKNIEQVADHSELSTLYRKAKDQWDGELVSDEERETRRKNKYDTISFGIREKFLLIGFLIPLPFAMALLVASIVLTLVTEDNASLFVIPMIFTVLFWVICSFFAYKKVAALFYGNALNAVPFITILLLLLALSIPTIYELTRPIHSGVLFTSSLTVIGIGFIWSIILTIPLLRIWSTPRLSGNAKFGLITLIAVVLLGAALYVSFM